MYRPRVGPLMSLTAVLVVGIYDVLLLGPATQWLKANAFVEFGDALPAPAQFMADSHWFFLLAVVATHGGAVWASHRRFGVPACALAITFSACLTTFWVWAMHLPFFSIAGAIK